MSCFAKRVQAPFDPALFIRLLILALSCTTAHCAGVGSVVAWGKNSDGQGQVPPGLTGVIGIACGNAHNVALKSDGTVAAWGSSLFGQTNVPPGLMNVTAVSAGSNYSVALTIR